MRRYQLFWFVRRCDGEREGGREGGTEVARDGCEGLPLILPSTFSLTRRFALIRHLIDEEETTKKEQKGKEKHCASKVWFLHFPGFPALCSQDAG